MNALERHYEPTNIAVKESIRGVGWVVCVLFEGEEYYDKEYVPIVNFGDRQTDAIECARDIKEDRDQRLFSILRLKKLAKNYDATPKIYLGRGVFRKQSQHLYNR